MGKKIILLKFILLLLFLFLNNVFASTIFPIEFANPDKIIVEGMKTNFYLIINDENIKKEVFQIEVTFFNETNNKLVLPYNGENIIKIPFEIPITINQNTMQVAIAGFNKDKYNKEKTKQYFLYQTSFKIHIKYPNSVFPSLISEKYNNQVAEKNFVYNPGSNAFIVTESNLNNIPTASYHFQGKRSYQSLDNHNIQNQKLKSDVEEILKNTRYPSTFNIKTDTISSNDSNIENITYAIGCNYQTYGESTIYNACVSRIVLKVASSKYFSNKENLVREYYFIGNFNSFGSPQKATTENEKYISEIENFIRNLALVDPMNMEYVENIGKFYPYGDLSNLVKNTDYSTAVNSELYKQIMEGGEPEIKTTKQELNIEKKYFELQFKSNLKKDILNTGILVSNSEQASFPLLIDIKGKAYDKNDKIIEDVSIQDLYENSFLMCKVIGNESQLGFKNGGEFANQEKIKLSSSFEPCYINSKGPAFYSGLHKKTEYVEVYIVDNNNKIISNKIAHKINVIDATPEIIFDQQNISMQDKAEGVFKFSIKDKYHKDFLCKVSFPFDVYEKHKIPSIRISEKAFGTGSYYTEFNCQVDKPISIRVEPPKLSNFDVLSELNSLSMVELQKDTAISLAGDLIGYGVEERLKNLTQTKQNLTYIQSKNMVDGSKIMGKIDNYEKTLRTLNKANKISGQAQDAIKVSQAKKNIDSLVKDTNVVLEDVQSKSTLEKVADAGIWGINILQSTVGAIAMAPKYIPILGKTKLGQVATKITGKFTLVFNLMTNVWKGNFQYISQSEKIDRAQEKSLPFPVIVEVIAKDGLQTKDIQTLNILYTWLDK